MRIFLDENVPVQIANALSGHEISSVWKEQLDGITNGKLLQFIEQKFDLLITADANMLSQNTFLGRAFSVIVLPTNSLPRLLGNIPAILQTVMDIEPLDYRVAVSISWSGARTMKRLDRVDAAETVLSKVSAFN
jgi:predicted nuclease of predicted toxin-antitoxin system